MNTPNRQQTDPESARRLMSLALDGELSADDAQRLAEYLEAHPEEIDWMESASLLSQATTPSPATDAREDALSRLSQSIETETASKRDDTPRTSKLIPFPRWLAAGSIAATVALVGGLVWNSQIAAPGPIEPQVAVVEYVATDIPDASTFVYSDAESGWTIVWVEAFEQSEGNHG